ncbi:hypothetical protein LJC15_05600, partial [Desulfovibrio sp. OttesenSCG-928-G11]|nr:hypothetical protein [Desulfovibrio sp. OttesenSCG-928-G11]
MSLKYTDEATRGIKLIDISSTSITGTYYEKIQYNETINHPVNGIETIIQESFLYTDFFIDNDSMVFILVNPSRRPNSVFKFLSINSHNVLSIKTSNINISQFCSFAKTALKDFRVKKIFFVPFNFSQKSTASISISSIDDAIEDSSQLGVDLPKNIQKIYFDCRHYNKKISGIITAAGSISVSSTAGSDF